MRRVILLTCVPVLAMIGAGCRHDGRTLRPARPDQNSSISTTSLVTTTVTASTVTASTVPDTADNPSLTSGDPGSSTSAG
ncbi:MAG: hypothetical protein WCI22_09170 [Actinomycetota bacterium]